MPKHDNSKTIDIHGLTSLEAKAKIEKEIANAPSFIKKIIVIHGFNSGNVLQETIRKNIRSHRIIEIVPSFFNEGTTVIYLK
jgi:DNA-nicking Smr family endonuclease